MHHLVRCQIYLLRLLVMEKVDPVTDSEGPELLEVINDDADLQDLVHSDRRIWRQFYIVSAAASHKLFLYYFAQMWI